MVPEWYHFMPLKVKELIRILIQAGFEERKGNRGLTPRRASEKQRA